MPIDTNVGDWLSLGSPSSPSRTRRRGQHPDSSTRLLSIVLLAPLCLLVRPQAVLAADTAIEATGSGWAGLYVPETWTPIRIRLSAFAGQTVDSVELALSVRPPTSAGVEPSEYPHSLY